MSGNVKGFDPICRWQAGLNKQRVENVINGSNDTFSFAVLLRSVRSQKAKPNVVRKKERASNVVVKFLAVVTLHKLYGALKMRVNIGMEIAKSGKRIRFKFERKSPQIVSEIIKTH